MPGEDGNDRLRARIENKHAAILASVFAGMLRAVIPRDSRAETLDPDEVMARYRAATGPMRDALADMLTEAGLAGARIGRRQVEALASTPRVNRTAGRVFRVNRVEIRATDWEMVNQSVLDWVVGSFEGLGSGYGDTLAASLVQTSEGQIRHLIAEWIRSGAPMLDLERALEEFVFARERAHLIASTEVTRAYAEGNMAAWRAAGIIQRRRWETAADELVCPICGPLQGQVRDLDEEFDGGILQPPAHPRCRCWLVPAVEDAPVEERPPAPTPEPAAVRLQPMGTPVSVALTGIPSRGKMRDPILTALEAIDQVHGDGQLDTLPIKTGKLTSAMGFYKYDMRERPIEIKLSTEYAEDAAGTLVHEIGHWLDHQTLRVAIKHKLRPLASSPAIDELWLQLAGSEAVQRWSRLKRYEEKVTIRGVNGDVEAFADTAVCYYALRRDEVWARAYTQWVTVRSGNARLVDELRRVQQRAQEGGLPWQWSDEDFEPIATAIDQVMREKGWVQ